MSSITDSLRVLKRLLNEDLAGEDSGQPIRQRRKLSASQRQQRQLAGIIPLTRRWRLMEAFGFGPSDEVLEDFRKAQKKLREILTGLWEEEASSEPEIVGSMETLYRSVADITSLSGHYTVQPLGGDGKIRNLKKQRFRGVDVRLEWRQTGSPSVREAVFAVVKKCLEDGTIFRLRPCIECGKFLVMRQKNQRFDTQRCSVGWHNRQLLQGAVIQRRRQEVRAEAVTRARKLKKEGLSAMAVLKETGLGQRVLVREGVFDNDDF